VLPFRSLRRALHLIKQFFHKIVKKNPKTLRTSRPFTMKSNSYIIYIIHIFLGKIEQYKRVTGDFLISDSFLPRELEDQVVLLPFPTPGD
jgi:hypothetical protein